MATMRNMPDIAGDIMSIGAGHPSNLLVCGIGVNATLFKLQSSRCGQAKWYLTPVR
jgi:hypothetical protein